MSIYLGQPVETMRGFFKRGVTQVLRRKSHDESIDSLTHPNTQLKPRSDPAADFKRFARGYRTPLPLPLAFVVGAVQQQSSIFFKLPLEIRRLIYLELIASFCVHLYPVPDKTRKKTKRRFLYSFTNQRWLTSETWVWKSHVYQCGDTVHDCLSPRIAVDASEELCLSWPKQTHVPCYLDVALMRTCSQAYFECRDILYSSNKFSFCYDTIFYIPFPPSRFITSFQIIYSTGEPYHHPPPEHPPVGKSYTVLWNELEGLMEYMPVLRTLRVITGSKKGLQSTHGAALQHLRTFYLSPIKNLSESINSKRLLQGTEGVSVEFGVRSPYFNDLANDGENEGYKVLLLD